MEKVGAYTDRATEGGEWRPGNPATGQQATPMLAAYFNMLQRELVGVVESAGMEPDKEDDSQLLKAIRRLRGGAATNFGQWLWSDTTAGNPGAGRVALDDADPATAGHLFITEASAETVDFTQSLGLLRSGDTITLQERDSAAIAHRFRVTGAGEDLGAYRSIPVAYVSGDGELPDAEVVVSVLLTQAGAAEGSTEPLFMPRWWPDRASIPAGYVAADGQLLSRALFPDAWAGVSAGVMPTVADATWLSTPTQRGKYTAGDGISTFRMPDYNGKAAGSLGAPFFRGDGALSAGAAGVLQPPEVGSHAHGYTGVSHSNFYTFGGINDNQLASQVSTFAATTGTVGGPENRPLALTGCWIVRLFGAVANSGAVDAAHLATELANVAGALSSGLRFTAELLWSGSLGSAGVNMTLGRPLVPGDVIWIEHTDGNKYQSHPQMITERTLVPTRYLAFACGGGITTSLQVVSASTLQSYGFTSGYGIGAIYAARVKKQ